MTWFALAFVAGVAVRECARQRRVDFEGLARQEAHRNTFGELRTELMMAVIEDRVDPRSQYFALLYAILTPLMRHPESYHEAVAVLDVKDGSTPPPTPVPPNEVERDLLHRTARRLDDVLADYLPLWRFLVWVHRKVTPLPLWVAVRARRAAQVTQASERLMSMAKLVPA